MPPRYRLLALVTGGVLAASSLPAFSQAQVTRGDFQPFAAGSGTNISGHAQMVRRANDTTFVSIHVEGLDPTGTYASHVHKLPCGDSDAGGHFQQIPGAGTTPPNEIWPGDGPFTSNDAGIANEVATAPYVANPDAVSVVVHDVGNRNAKVACADLS